MPHTKGKIMAGFGSAKKDKLENESNTRDNKKSIQSHIKAAEYFTAAAKCHYEAARLHEEGNHETADHKALVAIGYATKGVRCQMDDARHHTFEA